MRVSVEWLKEWCPIQVDGREISRILTERGLTVDAVETLDDDTVIEIDVPANRPDALGHRGVAREIAASCEIPLKDPVANKFSQQGPTLDIKATDFCPRYTASVVRHVSMNPTPSWMRKRLEAAGVRSINLIVDISNYVMLDLGQPVHFFDLQKTDLESLTVRMASDGETLETLDGETRKLDSSMGVIADRSGAIALAGVMGGASTEIGDHSSDVLIEAAHFQPNSIRKTARTLGLHTDASHRFERGVDPESPPLAQALAQKLLTELAGGKVDQTWIDTQENASAPETLKLRLNQLKRLLGYQPSREEVHQCFKALEYQPSGDDPITITVPSWRFDLSREVDLVEEVGRHLGFDRIPAIQGRIQSTPTISRSGRTESEIEERVRDQLTGLGFHEAFSYAMIAEDEDSPFVPSDIEPSLALSHPLAEGWSRLRRSILPGLVQAASLNLRRGNDQLNLFEVGKVFLPHNKTGELPEERIRVGILWSGLRAKEHWSQAKTAVRYTDLAGICEAVIRTLDPDLDCVVQHDQTLPGFTPGQSAILRDPNSNEILAQLGRLEPSLAKASKIKPRVYLAEIEISHWVGSKRPIYQAKPISKFPHVQRDLSILLAGDLNYRTLEEALRAVPAPAPVSMNLIDRFTGGDLPDGTSAILVRFTLRPTEATLTDEQTEAYRHALISQIDRLEGASLRES